MVASLAAAIVVAVPMGIVAYCRPRLGRLILGGVGIVQTLPAMAVLVFTIPLLGLGPYPAIFALFLYSLLPIVRNAHIGLSNIPQNLRESADALGLSRMARLRLIELPLASTSILAGIKTAAVINVGTATIGALVGAGGFGQPILTGIRLDDFSPDPAGSNSGGLSGRGCAVGFWRRRNLAGAGRTADGEIEKARLVIRWEFVIGRTMKSRSQPDAPQSGFGGEEVQMLV